MLPCSWCETYSGVMVPASSGQLMRLLQGRASMLKLMDEFPSSLLFLKESLFDPCGFNLTIALQDWHPLSSNSTFLFRSSCTLFNLKVVVMLRNFGND